MATKCYWGKWGEEEQGTFKTCKESVCSGECEISGNGQFSLILRLKTGGGAVILPSSRKTAMWKISVEENGMRRLNLNSPSVVVLIQTLLPLHIPNFISGCPMGVYLLRMQRVPFIYHKYKAMNINYSSSICPSLILLPHRFCYDNP